MIIMMIMIMIIYDNDNRSDDDDDDNNDDNHDDNSDDNNNKNNNNCEKSPRKLTQIAKFMGRTWGPPGSCRPQMGQHGAHLGPTGPRWAPC